MPSGVGPADARGRARSIQGRAAHALRTIAKPYRFRMQTDTEGFPFIPGRYGRIEWYCDGVECSACPLPGQFGLAVYTDRPRLFARLWAIPDVRRHQTGDTEMRAVFPIAVLEQVAGVIRAKRWGGAGRGHPQNFAIKPGQTAASPPKAATSGPGSTVPLGSRVLSLGSPIDRDG
jgi:hypothetical protein